MPAWLKEEWVLWLLVTAAMLPLMQRILFRWAPRVETEWPKDRALTFAVIGFLVFALVQPWFVVGKQEPPPPGEPPLYMRVSRYWWLMSALKAAAALVGLIILKKLATTPFALGLRRFRFVREVLWALAGYAAILPILFFLTALSDSEAVQKPARVLMDAESGRLRWAMGFCLCIVTPLHEEIAFRGLIQGGIRRAWPAAPAVIASSLVFMLVHEPRSLWIQVFILGAFLGWVYDRCRSIWPSVIVHAVHNLIVFLGLVLKSRGT